MMAIRHRVTLLSRKSFSVLVLFCSLAYGVGQAQLKPLRRVLILNEVNTSFPGIPIIDEGIRAAFENSPYKLEVYREYLDTIYFPDEVDQQRFRAFYISKYRDHQPDVIITVGPSPLKFMSETHQEAFPGVPIVFCLPHYVPTSPSLDHDFTGVENDLAAFETVEAAMHLKPDTRHVVVVGGTSLTDTQIEEIAREQLSSLNKNLDISYLTNLAMPDLLERLKRLPQQTIVLLTSFSRDASGAKFISGSEAAPMIVAAANGPVFSLIDIFMNHGEVGGKLSYLREQGRLGGSLALRILGGEKPQDIPRIKAGTTYIFDSRALKRWGLKESNLPAGSIMLNRQPSIWEAYKWYIVGGICLLLAQTLLILGLLWQRANRRKAEAERIESEERFRLVANTAPVMIWMSGTDKLCNYFNEPWLDFTGRTLEQELGNGWADGIHPDDLQGCLGTYATSFDSREKFQMEYRLRRNNGEYRWILDIGIPRFNQDGSFAGYIGGCVDVTERRSTEETRLKYAAIVESSDDAIISLDLSGTITSWNVGAERLFGYSAGEALGQSILFLSPAETRDDSMLRKLLRGQVVRHYEAVRQRKDGSSVDISLTAYPLVDAKGVIVGVSGISRDISERKKAERSIAEMTRKLIEAQEQEAARIGRELHDDINQRLAFLAIELRQLQDDPSEVPTRAQELQKQTIEISNDVQALSHDLHSSKLEYLGVIEGMKSWCREFGDRQKMEIVFKSEMPRGLSLDIGRTLFRVLQEGLQNAAKHSGVKRVDVQLREDGGEIHLMVSDSGRGFDVNEALQGKGLGLTSMHERVRLVKGTMAIDSKPMGGTRIRISVPVEAKPDLQQAAG